MTMQMPKRWEPSATYCATILHVFVSIAIGQASRLQEWNLVVVWAILLGITTLKEFWADLTWLENDTVWGSCLDFAAYQWGFGIALLSLSTFWLSVCVTLLTVTVAVLIDMRSQGEYP